MARDEFVKTWSKELPSAVACFEDDFDACIAHLRLPIAHRRVTRTTNLLERLFLEERLRTKTIPHAFGERAVLKLMFAAILRASHSWLGIDINGFERRQLPTLREELQQQFHHQNTVAFKPASHSTITVTRGLDQFVCLGYIHTDADSNAREVKVSTFKKDGTLVLVALNCAADEQISITLRGEISIDSLNPIQSADTHYWQQLEPLKKANSHFRAILPSQSITTFIGSGVIK